MADTYVMSPVTGAKVPLAAVATLTSAMGARQDRAQKRRSQLTVRAFPGDHRLARRFWVTRATTGQMALPPGYHIGYGGEYENQQETFGEMRKALITSLVLTCSDSPFPIPHAG